MDVSGDSIATAVLEKFSELPKRRKPQIRTNGIREWVPLSGIVLDDVSGLNCIAIGTGMKCLPETKVAQANGIILHDWHAEIVCIRAFNRFLLEECKVLSVGGASRYVKLRSDAEGSTSIFQPFSIREDVKIHMYCSEAPCGDASMELTIAAQPDSTPWDIPKEATTAASSLTGRGYFSELGIVRRKPSRPDAPPTLSKSCSDKLSLHQCTSLLSSLTSLMVSPQNAYIHTLTLPASQYSASGCERAFSATGRMVSILDLNTEGGFRFVPFRVLTTEREFEFSRRSGSAGNSGELTPSNLAAAWSPYFEESLIGGVLQGRKFGDPRGASVLCRRAMWDLTSEVILGLSNVGEGVGSELSMTFAEVQDYDAVKELKLLKHRREVKSKVLLESLRGWTRNVQDNFTIKQEL